MKEPHEMTLSELSAALERLDDLTRRLFAAAEKQGVQTCACNDCGARELDDCRCPDPATDYEEPPFDHRSAS